MSKNPETVIFFGSGLVAARSLTLLTSDFKIEAIITKPITASEMKSAAKNVPVYTVSNKFELDLLLINRQFKSSLGILIDFGIIVNQTAIESFPLGIINSHFSLLPEWRGPDPITFAILSGQKQTGVSLMILSDNIDEGPLLAQTIYDISPDITAPKMTTDLIELSDILLKTTIPLYKRHEIIPLPQENNNVTGSKNPSYSKKLSKKDGSIDWTKSAIQLEREIRAFIEWPKSTTFLAGRQVVITDAEVSNRQGSPGTLLLDGKKLLIHCGDGSLEIKQIKPTGKSTMSAQAFLAGYRKYL